MAIAFVQGNSVNGSAGTSPQALPAYATSVAVGDLIVLLAGGDGGQLGNATSVSDSLGNTYTHVPSFDINNTGGTLNLDAFYSVVSHAGASNVISLVFNSANENCVMVSQHFNGFTGTATLDKTQHSSNATSTTITSGTTATLTTATELVVGLGIHDSTVSAISLGTGYTNLTTVSIAARQAAMESKLVAATTAVSATFTIAATRINIGGVLTFMDVANNTKTPSVSDNVTITDTIADISRGNATTGQIRDIHPSDNVTITENVQMKITNLGLSVFDSVTVTEALVYDPDKVYVSEFVTVNVVSGGGGTTLNVNVFDNVIVTEGLGIVQKISVYTLAGTPTNNFAFLESSTGRAVARDSSGTMYAVYNALNPVSGFYTIRLSRSTDGGTTWAQSEIAAYASNSLFTPKIAIDSADNIHVVYEGYGAASNPSKKNIHYVHGTWGSFSSIVDLTDDTLEQFVPSIAVDQYDTLHVVWYGFSSAGQVATFDYQIRYLSITGGTPSAITTLTSQTVQQIDPTIAVDNQNNVHIVWTGLFGAEANNSVSHIVKNYSTQVWGAREVAIASSSTLDFFKPNLVIGKDDTLLVSAYLFDTGGGANAIQTSFYTAGSWGAPTSFTIPIQGYYAASSVGTDATGNYYLAYSAQEYHVSTSPTQINLFRYVGGVWKEHHYLTEATTFQTRPTMISAIWPKVGKQPNIPLLGSMGIWNDSGGTVDDTNASNIVGWQDIGLAWQTTLYLPIIVDSVTVTENVSASRITAGIALSVFDSVTVTENVSVVEGLVPRSISVFDSVKVIDFFIKNMKDLFVMAYLPVYRVGAPPISDLPWSQLSAIAYFAIAPNTDGTLNTNIAGIGNVLTDIDNLVTAGHAAGKKVLITIGGSGGATDSDWETAINDTNRPTLISNIVTFINAHSLDGIDLDWEPFSTSGDSVNFIKFVKELRTALGGTPLITFFLVSGDTFKWAMSATIQDHINYIAPSMYDFSFGNSTTVHDSPVFHVTGQPSGLAADDVVANFNGVGVKKSKLLMGVAWYTATWTHNSALFQAATPNDFTAQLYTDLTGVNGYSSPTGEQWDASAQANYLTGSPFTSYNGIRNIQAKIDYALANGIGGLIIFELGQAYLGTDTYTHYPLLTPFRVQNTPQIFVSDSITVTENVSLSIVVPRAVVVNENITVSENVNVVIPILTPSVFDSVTITENIKLSIPLPVSVFDSVTVTESVTLTGVLTVSVFDSVTVSENVSVQVNVTPSVFDSVTVTENVSLKLSFAPSVFDNVTVSENVNLNIPFLLVSVFDSITVSEFIVDAEQSTFSVIDNVTVTENVNVYIPILLVSVFDNVTVTENVQTSVRVAISVTDNVTVSENVQLNVLFNVSVFDSITVSEAVTMVENTTLSVFDSITVTENVQMNVPVLISVFDSITVTENVNITVIFNISVFDNVTVTENYTTAEGTFVSVFDTILTNEKLFMVIPILFLSVSDQVNVSEFFNSGGNDAFSTFDNVTVSENVSLTIPVLFLSVFESVTVTEAFTSTGQERVSVSDNVTVSENINLYIPVLFVSVADNVTVSESVTNNTTPIFISVFDSVTVSEQFIGGNSIFVTDSVTITEAITLTIPVIFVSVFEQVTVSEFFVDAESYRISVVDNVTVSENVNVFIPQLFVSVFDSITVSENFSGTVAIPQTVSDNVTVSEVVTIKIANYVFVVSDQVTVTDFFSGVVPIPLSVFDSVTVSEAFFGGTIFNLSVVDTVTVSDIYTFDSIKWNYEPQQFRPRGYIVPPDFEGSMYSGYGDNYGGSAY